MTDPVLLGVAIGLVAGVGGVLALVIRAGRRRSSPAVPQSPRGSSAAPVASFAPETPALAQDLPAPEMTPDEAGGQALAPQLHVSAPAVPVLETVLEAVVRGAAVETREPGADAVAPPPLPYSAGLVAPVELWIGDIRVLVKDGTRTQAQFRSYADSLLSALKDARGETR